MATKRVAAFLFALSVMFFGLSVFVFAQTSTTGLISGVVTDPTGAAVPNVSVTAV